METIWEASRDELLALKEIRMSGRLADQGLASRLMENKIVAESENGQLKLTATGRRVLLRGSPALWTLL